MTVAHASTQPFRGIPAGEVARRLAGRVGQLVRELLPAGRLDHAGGDEWCVAGVHGAAPTRHGSCRVHLRGEKAGVWADFSTGESGDALDLVAAVLYRGDKKAAYKWALTWLGISSDAAPAALPSFVPERAPREDVEVEARKRAGALRLWLEARPGLAGTPAAAYLAARGIELAQFGRPLRSLRFHPVCFCAEADARLPALLAVVTDREGRNTAVHRTWLAEQGGVWGKAKLEAPKKALGRLQGGTIRLWRGASGKPLADAPQGEAIVIGEGIETCLSVAVVCRDLRVLCGISLANMASVALPPQIGAVILLADNDGVNAAAAAGLQRAVNHFAARGEVRLARAPFGKDFNDCLRLQ